jgi:hypothetical protein
MLTYQGTGVSRACPVCCSVCVEYLVVANQKSKLNVFERASKFVSYTIEDMIDIVASAASDCLPAARPRKSVATYANDRPLVALRVGHSRYPAARDKKLPPTTAAIPPPPPV